MCSFTDAVSRLKLHGAISCCLWQRVVDRERECEGGVSMNPVVITLPLVVLMALSAWPRVMKVANAKPFSEPACLPQL